MKSAVSPRSLTGAPARVARILLETGPITASEVADHLGLTGTAVRRHLDALVDAGFAEASETAPFGPTKPRGRGRPAKLFTLTAAGRSAFDQGYDDLALAALRHMADVGGNEAVLDFARGRAGEMVRRYQDLVDDGATVERRAELLAQALRDDGFASSADLTSELGIQLCQHNCPVAHVAEEFPQLCDAETEAFGRLIGTHVARLATLSHGDGLCTTHIPLHPIALEQQRTHDRGASTPRGSAAKHSAVASEQLATSEQPVAPEQPEAKQPASFAAPASERTTA